jgi:hypothetical protein
MSQRGVHFALLPTDVQRLRNAENDVELLAVIQDDIEERWEEPWLFQTDKGWAGIHRCLTDGSLACDDSEYPLSACILGGEQLYRGDDFVVSLLVPTQVVDAASAPPPADALLQRHRDRVDLPRSCLGHPIRVFTLPDIHT